MHQKRQIILLIIALLTSFLLSCNLCSPVSNVKRTTPISQNIVEDLNSKTAALMAKEGLVSAPFCSAVWISDDALLTAAHCINHFREAMSEKAERNIPFEQLRIPYAVASEMTQVLEAPKVMHYARVMDVTSIYDLAILLAIRGNGEFIPQHGVIQIAAKSPSLGSNVHIVGHTQTLYYSYTKGVVSALRNELPVPLRGPFLQVSAPAVSHGNSGGLAANDNRELIGIASLAHEVGISFFVAVDSIRNFVRMIMNADDDNELHLLDYQPNI
jgi:hypothetical protein